MLTITRVSILVLLLSCNQQLKQPVTNTSQLQSLVSPTDTSSAEPSLFTDKKGRVYLSWIQKRKDTSFLKFSTLLDDQWSAPMVIASGDNWFVNWADYPMLVSDEGNNMIAHFLAKSGKGTYAYDVKIVTSNNRGKSWSEPSILHDDGKKAEHGFVSMKPFKENYFISWLDGRNTVVQDDHANHQEEHKGQMTLRGAIMNKQGINTAEWELDDRVCDCCQTSAAITENGPVVVYRDRSPGEIRDISIVRLVNGKWTIPANIFPDNWKITGCPVNGPSVDAYGNVVVIAWFSSPDKKGQVNIVFSGDGGATFNSPVRMDEGNGIGRVDVVMLNEKSAMVSWMEGAVIKAARVYADGTRAPSIIIDSSSTSRSAGFPQMTKSGNSLIFAWSDNKLKKIKIAKLVLD